MINGIPLTFFPTENPHSWQQSTHAAVFQLTHPTAPGDSTSGDVLALTFDNANTTPEVYGVDDTGGSTNYFTGTAAADMITNIPEYAQVVVQDLYPGINLVLTSTAQRNVEYNFDIAPGASLSEVQLTWNGATSLSLDPQGDLLIGTSGGNVVQDAPVFYQTDSNGQQVPVIGQQVLLGGNTFGFAMTGSYNSSSPLVVDPTLDFSTYLGGSGNDDAYGIAVDGTGNSYITGSTASTNFPTTTGAFTSGSGAATGVFVTKLSSTGSEIYSAYLAGTTSGSIARGNSIAVDLSGNAYVVGTASGAFPALNTSTNNSNMPDSSGNNAFAFELNATGNDLHFSYYLDPTGTSTPQTGLGVTVTAQGVCYAAVDILQTYGLTANIYQNLFGPTFSLYETLGGSTGHTGSVQAVGITANEEYVYLTGSISGTALTGSTGAYQTSNAGMTDAYVFRAPGVSTYGQATRFTFLGGTSADAGAAIAAPVPGGPVYVTGATSSSNFPTTSGAYQTSLAGSTDAFVAELNSNLSSLVYSTDLGGSGSGTATQSGTGIAVNSSGLITVVGSTIASNFPTLNSLYAFAGATDGFITQFTPNFAGLNYSSFWGGADVGPSLGTATNVVTGVATDLQGDVYVAGYTNSTDFPTSSGAIQGSNAGGYDAFISEILNTPAAPVFTGISPASSSSTVTITSSQNIQLLGTGTSGATVTVSLRGVGVLGTTTVSSGTWDYNYSGTTLAAGTYDFTATQTISTVVSPATPDYLVTIAPAGAPTVGLSAPSSTYSLEPSFRVTASDPNGSLGTATVTLQVYNSTGTTLQFTTTGNLLNGYATIKLSTALTVGTSYQVDAQVTGLAGVVGTSPTQNITVGTVSSAWSMNAVAPSSNVNGGLSDLELGNVSDSHGLILDQNGGSMDGGASLVYNSDSVSQSPIIQASLQSSNAAALPSTISGTLIWDLGNTTTTMTFSDSVPATAAPGDLLTVAVQTTATVTTSRRYVWELQVNTPAGVQTTTGSTFVDAQDGSPFGSGWTFSPVDQLVSIPANSAYTLPAGFLRLYGTGGYGFYASSGSSYTSPSGDNGTLTAATSGGVTTYTYGTPDGASTTFNSSGQETQWTSSDGLQTLQYRYGSGFLTGMTAIDGTVSTFSYSSNLLQTIQTSNSRTTTLGYSGTDVTSITDPSGAGSSYTYASHRLTQDTTGLTQDEWAYGSSGALATATWGATSGGGQTNMAKTAYTPAITQGLGGLVVGAAAAKTVNYYNDTTLDYLDSQSRPTVEVDPIGATTTLAYDTNGFVTQTSDPLGRTITEARDSSEYVTLETSYATGTTSYAYSTGTRHLLTSTTNALSQTNTYAYDSLGHLTAVTNALNQVTTYGYSATTGQQTSVTDPLNHTTTSAYNSLRQLTLVTDALNNKTTYTYDLNGYEATMVNALGNTTTMTNNVVGQVITTVNALGKSSTMAYDAATGMETSSTDPLSEVSKTQYDLFGQGQVLDSLAAVGSTVQDDSLSQYNLAGEDTGTRNADGYWSTNILDPLDRVTGTLDSLGDTTQTNFDLAGQQISARDSDGGWTYNQYNSQGLVTESIDAKGNVTTMAYNAIGLLTSQTDPSGNVTANAYDALNRVKTVTTVLGTSTTTYDAAGNTIDTIDPQGNTTSMAYDADNRNTVTVTGYGTAQAETTTQAYDAVGDVLTSTDARGNVTTMGYDAIRENTTITTPTASVGLVATMVYDADGNEIVSTNPQNQSTTLGYNALNQQTQTTDANGLVSTQVFDPIGQTVGSVNPLFNVNETVPNSVGQTIYTSDGLGNLTKSVYDANGNLVSQTDANGNTTQWTYNSNNQQLTQTDALGNVTKMAYNSSGWLITQTDPLGNVTTFGYDAQGRQVTMEEPSTGVTTTAYNSINQVIAVTDQLGHTTSYAYDSQGNQTVVTNALGNKTTMTYDQNNNETSLTDSDGNVTTFAYNTLNEETLTTNPLGFKTTSTYYNNGQVSTVTDPLGREEIYSYDNDEQTIGVVWKNASGTTVNTLTYTYDSSGNVLTAANAAGTYTMGYDANNRVTSVAGLFGVSLTYGYDAVGNRTTVQDSKGGTTTVVYNADNEWTITEAYGTGMSQMREDQSYTADSLPSTDIRYSNLTGTTKVGETDYSYNSDNDVTNITYKNGSGTALQQVTYSYDLAGRVTTQNLNGTTSSYLYDAINELTSEGVSSYSYDANGNRTMAGYSTGTGNELLNDGTYTYTYDNAGNMIEKSKGTGLETWYYTYDNNNKLSTVNETTNGTTSEMTIANTYDVFGNLVKEVEWTSATGTVTTEHVYSGSTLLMDLTSSNAIQTRYLSGTAANDWLAREDSSGNTYWYQTDRLGSVVGVTNSSGTMVDTITYDGFGNILLQSGSTYSGNLLFQGMWFDPLLGEYDDLDRVYGPTTGDFNTQDPSGFNGGSINLYEALGNEPTDATDPMGLATVKIQMQFLLRRKVIQLIEALQGKVTTLNQDVKAFINSFQPNSNYTTQLQKLKAGMNALKRTADVVENEKQLAYLYVLSNLISQNTAVVVDVAPQQEVFTVEVMEGGKMVTKKITRSDYGKKLETKDPLQIDGDRSWEVKVPFLNKMIGYQIVSARTYQPRAVPATAEGDGYGYTKIWLDIKIDGPAVAQEKGFAVSDNFYIPPGEYEIPLNVAVILDPTNSTLQYRYVNKENLTEIDSLPRETFPAQIANEIKNAAPIMC